MEKWRAEISAVIAALNEEEGIGPTLKELQKVLGRLRLIVVDEKVQIELLK
jgi:glycosyltransferase involved in cell wall biosynthesis